SRRRHTRFSRDWSSDVCSSDLKGVPAEVTETLDKIWAEKIKNSAALKKYAASKGALFAPEYGEAAQKAVFPALQNAAWLLHASGKAKVSPDTVGIPKP